MKARVFRLESDEHEAASALLPWYANGTLEAQEMQRVRDHLALCPRCRSDLTWQQRLCSAAPDAQAPTSPWSVDRDWAALARRISRDDAGSANITGERHRPPIQWWPIAFAVQTALVLALAMTWAVLPPRDEAFHALGQPAAAPSANVLVVFRPAATEADIRRALRETGAQLVGGPTATDAYLLRLDPLTSRTLAHLRADGAVQHVDSLEAQIR